MTDFHLAQINIGRFRLPVEHPVNADFVAALDHVNALAEAAPGFVWRLKGAGNNASDLHPYDDPNIGINMSVWTSMEALANFVYGNPEHRKIMRRRREWFEHMEVFQTLWWIPAGTIPTIEDGKARLETLRLLGPSPSAFLFHKPFAPPDVLTIRPILDKCA